MSLIKPSWLISASLILSILMTAGPIFATPSSQCFHYLNGSENKLDELVRQAELQIFELDAKFTRLQLEIDQESVASIGIYQLDKGALKITSLEVTKSFRRKGLGERLFKEVVKYFGRNREYKTTFIDDNQKSFEEALAKSYRKFPNQLEADHYLQALYATPAWKQRASVGLSNIIKFEVNWYNETATGLRKPHVELVVTGEDANFNAGENN